MLKILIGNVEVKIPKGVAGRIILDWICRRQRGRV
jgi:hypothetical protein